MTNGEMIQKIFPYATVTFGGVNLTNWDVVHVGIDNNTVFSQSWWNAEYQEPTTKNNSPKYCDPDICLRNEYNNVGCEDCEVTKSQELTTQERQAESDKVDAAFQDGYNNGYAQARFDYEQEPTYCPKFKNRQEKRGVFLTITAIEKCLNVIGNNDAIDDISVLKELVRKIEVIEDQTDGNDD